MKKYLLYSLFFFSLLFQGCEDSSVYDNSPTTNFEALWKIIDENYCFFKFKNIDWDDIHDRYAVQVNDTMNQYTLFDLLGNMLAELKDGHTNLYSSFNMARYWDWYEDYPPNFYEELLKKYLGKNYHLSGGLKYKKMANDQIGYLYYGSFSSGFSENNLDYMFLHFKNCNGLIIDVRNNGGGLITNAERLASRFIEKKLKIGYLQYKKGNGHTDFSDPKPIYLSPSDRIIWLRPIILLTNRHSYSATNYFVNIMRLLPNVYVIGDKTGGGSGLPFSSELPNGWGVRFSACPLLNIDMQHTEFGIDPDSTILLTETDLLKGHDTLIESAIEILKKQINDAHSIDKK